MATSENPEKLYQPNVKSMIGAAVVGAVLGTGAIAGVASAGGLTGSFWVLLGLLFGGGLGLSLSVILPQLRYNTGL